MHALVIYDSMYGNTEKIAQAIGAAVGGQVKRVDEVDPAEVGGIDLLIVGSPTQRFNATSTLSDWLERIPEGAITGTRVAAFDTRFKQEKIDTAGPLRFFVKLWGKSAWAATHIARFLKQKGGTLAAQPEGFYVRDTEGPLYEGELERAAGWASAL
ncbi:MAG: flavodoxin family protein [Chloroflexi bacterium]|nr:flavodoxin family protein [Chloroflexota bacterium]